jgi:predicted DNA-binding protein (UPF0251 family)
MKVTVMRRSVISTLRRIETIVTMEATAMRIVYTTELKIEVNANSMELRDTFTKLVIAAAEQIYGSAAMLSKEAPTITCAQTSREGKTVLPLFGAKMEGDE